MKLSKLIQQLQAIEAERGGDIECVEYVDNITLKSVGIFASLSQVACAPFVPAGSFAPEMRFATSGDDENSEKKVCVLIGRSCQS